VLAIVGASRPSTGTAERDAGETMMSGLEWAARSTLGADRNYDTGGFVAAMRRDVAEGHVERVWFEPGKVPAWMG